MAELWSVFGIAAGGAAVGWIIATLAIAIIGNNTKNTREQFETNCFVIGIFMLVIAVISVGFTWPVSHWFEIFLLAFGRIFLAPASKIFFISPSLSDENFSLKSIK